MHVCAVKKLKKLLIPIVALLAFSMLSTSVSAPAPEYYMARFYGLAKGPCWVHHGGVWPPEAVGEGSVHVRGSAIVAGDADYYWANTTDPNTCIRNRRSRMEVSWNNKKLKVWMWPSHVVWGIFNDTLDWFYLANMSFFGYHRGEAGLQFISGTAYVSCGSEPFSYLEVILGIETEPIPVCFVWAGAEFQGWPAAQQLIRGVTVWRPIRWSRGVTF